MNIQCSISTVVKNGDGSNNHYILPIKRKENNNYDRQYDDPISPINRINMKQNTMLLGSPDSTQTSSQLSNPFKFAEDSEKLSEYSPSIAKFQSISLSSNKNQFKNESSNMHRNSPFCGKSIGSYQEENSLKKKTCEPRCVTLKNKICNLQGKTSHLFEEEIDEKQYTLGQCLNTNINNNSRNNPKQRFTCQESKRMMIELVKCLYKNSNYDITPLHFIKEMNFDKNDILNCNNNSNLIMAPNNNEQISLKPEKNSSRYSFSKSICSNESNQPTLVSEEDIDEPTRLLCFIAIPRIVIVNSNPQLMCITLVTHPRFNTKESYTFVFKSLNTMKIINKFDSSVLTSCNYIGNCYLNIQYVNRKSFQKITLKIKMNSKNDCEEYVRGINYLLKNR